MQKLNGQTVIVVGATGGIGSVISRVLYEQGASVTLASRNEEKLLTLQRVLGEDRTFVVPTDASDIHAVAALFQKTKEKWGHVDVVINSVGEWNRLNINSSIEDAARLFESHYKGVLLPAENVCFVGQKFFRGQRNGLIINISSHAAKKPELGGNLSYGPAKAGSHDIAMRTFEELRRSLDGRRVRVSDIQPAIVNTPSLKGVTDEQRILAVQPEAIAEWIVDNMNNPEILLEKNFPSVLVLD